MNLPNTTGPITLNDVRKALANIDPNTTNSGALRNIIGRGSLTTIQNHLDAIRAERATLPTPVTESPQAPDELVQSIWAMAIATASAQTLSRLTYVIEERDALVLKSNQLANDLAAAFATADTLNEALTTALQSSVAASQEAAAAVLALDQQTASAAKLLEEVRVKADKDAAELTNALALATRDAQIERHVLQTTIDRLTDQIGELKSWMSKLTPANQ